MNKKGEGEGEVKDGEGEGEVKEGEGKRWARLGILRCTGDGR